VTFEISIISWAAIMLTYGFVWSRNERRKKAKVKFVQGLKGHKFQSIEELIKHWSDRGVRLDLTGEIDKFRHGDIGLEDALMSINAEMESHFRILGR
jgi:hypothetical protein